MRTEPAVIPFAVQRMICTGCGAETNATCNCGKPYLPKAERARRAIEESREKSNVALAKEIGVDEKTIRKARAASDQSEPERRIGLDGKSYPAKRVAYQDTDFDDESDPDEDADEKSVIIYAGTAIDLATKMQEIISRPNALTDEGREYIRRAADIWLKIVNSI
jgi:hypothetical protein